MSCRLLLVSTTVGLILGTLAGVLIAEGRWRPYLALRDRLAEMASLEIGEADRKTRLEQFRRISPKVDVAMVGDSHGARGPWAELLSGARIANRGIAGETAAATLHRLDSTLSTRPGTVVIQSGTNDLLAGRSPAEVADTVTELAALLAAADSKVVLTTLPLCLQDRCHRSRIEQVNARLESAAIQHDWTLVDLATALEEAGAPRVFGDDDLHLSPGGYLVWRDALCARAVLPGC